MTDLKQLLHDNVADAPSDHVDLTAVMAAGRRRVRRRRGGATAAVLAVAAVTVVAAVGGTGPGSGPGPSAPGGTVPVVSVGEARPAVEGRDYELVTSYPARDGSTRGRSVAGVSADGLLVVLDAPRPGSSSSRVGLVDPSTDRTSWLPGMHRLGRLLAADTDRLVFQAAGVDAPAVDVFDRAARSWSQVRWTSLPASVATVGYGEVWVEAGRAWITLPHAGRWQRFDLWSASLTNPGDVRDERRIVDDASGAAGVVATRQPDGALLVETPDGDPVVAVEGSDVELADVTDDAIVVRVPAGDDAGTYAYETGSGELLRLGGTATAGTSTLLTSGDYVAWGASGRELIARLLP
ncbi:MULTISPECIES: hypothetical protein [unclassified Nocardioides]|uniref:hypothetical protein n=1 Tax=unclassified Nocardioides TaxID=2615069 RepID=UPI0012E3AAD6|nr:MULTISPECIES: hypothetical protein [unclassified Nocardioides]